MIEKLTDRPTTDTELINHLSKAVGIAKQNNDASQASRPKSLRTDLTPEHWILLYTQVRDTLAVEDTELLNRTEHIGDEVEAPQMYRAMYNERYDEFAAKGFTPKNAGLLALLDVREEFTRFSLRDACLNEPQGTVDQYQANELCFIAGDVARIVWGAMYARAAADIPHTT